MVDKAKSVIVLHLGEIFLSDVMNETNATTMSWFESLYITKFLTHRQILKQQQCLLSMVE